ncbi:MAG: hypothetical protein ISS47_03015 [Candidatus Omnitrophica bacterium]|nr:hypothetical protein [Candidatus Omnitrophota bacterium]
MTIKKRFFLGVLIFIIFAVLLEITLRFAGYVFYTSRRIASNSGFSMLKRSEDEQVILCLGDSFTFGGNLPIEESYPFQLQKILNERNSNNKLTVINGGYCERNSAQILRLLPGAIRRYKPGTIILLVGHSNWFNFIGFDKERNFYSSLKDKIFDLRLYKMVKIITLNLQQKILLMQTRHSGVANAEKHLEKRRLSSIVDPERNILKEIATSRLMSVGYLNQIGEKEKASELFKKYFYIDTDSDLLVYQISECLNYAYELSLDEGTNYDPALILMDFQRRLENDRDLKDVLLRDYFLVFQNIQKSFKSDQIITKLKNDLEDIVSICRKNGITLIMQDYPLPYPMADMTLRNAALEHSLPLVRNSRVFSRLIEAGAEREEYSIEDGHCTAKGYRIMAENIYETIISEAIFPELSAEEGQ